MQVRAQRLHGSGVEDGARTHDIGYHKPALYQLSYPHRWRGRILAK
jgi:hypothetical protein